jgi:cupin fold WbuC family metalloprotein
VTDTAAPSLQVQLDSALFQRLLDEAASSLRKRSFYTLHASHQEPVQRLVIGLLPDSFVPIHRHTQAHQWELFIILSGAVDLLVFDDAGRVSSRRRIEAGSALCAVELPPLTWHSIVCQQPAVFIEIKQGPFDASFPAQIADYSTLEQTDQTAACLAWLQQARVGELSPFQRNFLA